MDIYICETDRENSQRLGSLCVRYLIQQNIEADIRQIHGLHQLQEYLAGNILLNVFMLGVEQEVQCLAENIKKSNEQNYIVLLGSDPAELFGCITPSLRPSGIIVRPVEDKKLHQLLDEIWHDYKNLDEHGEQFVFSIKAARYMVPCSKILYFESSSKKIILRTVSQEFEFYGSMQKISDELPEAFIRVHRSFIVNAEKISEVDFGENTIYFEDDTFVYLSRSYKPALQEYLMRQK